MACILSDYLRNRTPKYGDCGGGKINTANWGFETNICQRHYLQAQLLIENNASDLNGLLQANGDPIGGGYVPRYAMQQVIRDHYVMLLVLMQTTEAVDGAMMMLARELDGAIAHQKQHKDDLDERFISGKKEKGYIRLSRVLSCYEGLCWFPLTNTLFAGALTGDDFNNSLALGIMAKDPGAGSLHGDLSHRLQWHAVMRIVTNGFQVPFHGAWTMTPLEMFTTLGTIPYRTRNLWGALFDAQGMPNYSDPSNLYRALRQSGYGVLKEKMDKVYHKRVDVERECGKAWTAVWQDARLAAVRGKLDQEKQAKNLAFRFTPPMPLDASIVGIVYEWKRAGGPPNHDNAWKTASYNVNAGTLGWYAAVPAAATADRTKHDAALAVLDRLAETAAFKFWEEHIDIPPYKQRLRGSQRTHYTAFYNGAAPVPGIIKGDNGLVPNVMSIQGRITASQQGMSEFFEYGTKVGARKVI